MRPASGRNGAGHRGGATRDSTVPIKCLELVVERLIKMVAFKFFVVRLCAQTSSVGHDVGVCPQCYVC